MQSVKLIGITKPTSDLELNGANELVAYCARVSNPSNQMNIETAPKLIKYLIKNKHWSPFEIVSLVMEISTTRDISRQILRHRSFVFQEFSQRYAVSESFTSREARLQDNKNRQNSIDIQDTKLAKDWERMQEAALEASTAAYQWALNKGIAKEQARAVLPEGLTNTTLYMSGTLRSWIHYIDVRSDPSTQKEHREIAEMCKKIILENFPDLGEYWPNDN
jgi:thymidylate synthase (FAD)